MSSYLVAMVIGNYTRVPTSDSRQFMLVRSEAVDLVVQSATYVPPIMEQLESKLNVPYPLSKLDHAGTQGFGGGMENYGLIIYA
jgi:aminopeptidase N